MNINVEKVKVIACFTFLLVDAMHPEHDQILAEVPFTWGTSLLWQMPWAPDFDAHKYLCGLIYQWYTHRWRSEHIDGDLAIGRMVCAATSISVADFLT